MQHVLEISLKFKTAVFCLDMLISSIGIYLWALVTLSLVWRDDGGRSGYSHCVSCICVCLYVGLVCVWVCVCACMHMCLNRICVRTMKQCCDQMNRWNRYFSYAGILDYDTNANSHHICCQQKSLFSVLIFTDPCLEVNVTKENREFMESSEVCKQCVEPGWCIIHLFWTLLESLLIITLDNDVSNGQLLFSFYSVSVQHGILPFSCWKGK